MGGVDGGSAHSHGEETSSACATPSKAQRPPTASVGEGANALLQSTFGASALWLRLQASGGGEKKRGRRKKNKKKDKTGENVPKPSPASTALEAFEIDRCTHRRLQEIRVSGRASVLLQRMLGVPTPVGMMDKKKGQVVTCLYHTAFAAEPRARPMLWVGVGTGCRLD